MNTKHIVKLLIHLILGGWITACFSRIHSENEQLMNQAKQLLEQNSDSALALLDLVNTALLDDTGNRGKSTGKEITEIGEWKGIDLTDIVIILDEMDLKGNPIRTRSISGIPRTTYGL